MNDVSRRWFYKTLQRTNCTAGSLHGNLRQETFKSTGIFTYDLLMTTFGYASFALKTQLINCT